MSKVSVGLFYRRIVRANRRKGKVTVKIELLCKRTLQIWKTLPNAGQMEFVTFSSVVVLPEIV